VRTSIGIIKRSLVILLIVLFTSFLAKPGKAQVLLEESFEGQSVDGGTVYGGTFTQGKVGLGWSSSLVREGSKEEGRVFIQHDLPSGFFQDEGTLEFFLQRKEKPLSGEVREESIIEISDADYKSIITVKILWDNPKLLGSEGSGLQVYGNYLIEELASEPWGGEYFPFGRAVEPGEWVHVAVTWGTGKKENNVYLNGVVLTRVRNEYGIHHEPKSLYLADILEKATHVRIGGESFTSDPEITWSPLSNSIVDELKIHDQAFNPMFPEIRSVSHDVFSVAGYSGKLVSGDTYTVTLQAPPGGTATFDLIQPASTSNEITIPEKVRIVGHPMSEDPENPGTYTGVHIVKYGEDVKDGQIIGHFVNAFGVKADPVPASRQITVDTRVYMDVRANNDLVPADGESKSGITII
jgi:hypothetical protein